MSIIQVRASPSAEQMVDPTSDLEEGLDEDEAPSCDNCGDPIIENPDHRVHTWVEDGQAHHRHFCGEDCLAEWQA